jgi:hypothetical protein
MNEGAGNKSDISLLGSSFHFRTFGDQRLDFLSMALAMDCSRNQLQ